MWQTLTNIWVWLNQTIYDFVTEVVAFLVEWVVVFTLTAKLWAVKFSWDVASNILENLNLSSHINAAFSQLDGSVISYITFFRMPEVITILFQALVTKFTFRLIFS